VISCSMFLSTGGDRMDVFGLILLVVGLILMVAGKGVYRKGLKSARKLTESPKEMEEYMMLVGSGMAALRLIGFVIMIIGSGMFLMSLYM